jgi:dipeptidase E
MSYTKFKNKSQYKEIFETNSKITQMRTYPDKRINLILPSEHLVKTLKPVLEKMLKSELDDKKVALIPNGGVDEARMNMSYVYLQEFTTINNMYLKQLDLDKWPTDVLIESLNSCDVIVISGGFVSMLLKSIDKAGIREFLVKLIKSGKPFIGFSAGAMCLSSSTIFAEKYIGESDAVVKGLTPLGIIDFEIYPHFEDEMLGDVKKLLPDGIKGYALHSSDAIVITDGTVYSAGNPVEV